MQFYWPLGGVCQRLLDLRYNRHFIFTDQTQTVRELILITISGHDKPAITSAVTGVLTKSKVNVLDIGQAVIHDVLSLGMLVELPAGCDSAAVIDEVLHRMQDQGMQVRFQSISEESYREWVE